MTNYPTRDLTFEERTKWGTCPVCGRGQDMPCAPWFDEGVDSTLKSYPVECTAEDSDFYKVNVHEARLSAAPQRVRLVPVEEPQTRKEMIRAFNETVSTAFVAKQKLLEDEL